MWPSSMPRVSSSVPPSFLGEGSPARALRMSATIIASSEPRCAATSRCQLNCLTW